MAQQNQIANPKSGNEPQVKGPQMNDRDRLNDVLSMEKYLTDSFNIAVREASHDALYQDILTVLNETHACAREMFTLMFQKGWYKLEAEDPQAVSQAYQQFSNYSTQFPYPKTMQ
jgi:spore coat protein CotF